MNQEDRDEVMKFAAALGGFNVSPEEAIKIIDKAIAMDDIERVCSKQNRDSN